LKVKYAAISTRAKNYDSLTKDPPSITPPNGPLTLEKPTIEPALRPPKGVLCRNTHNPNAWSSKHYSIVEDIFQAPCAMLEIEVLQSCPTQHKASLSTIGGIDLAEFNFISFYTNCNKSRLSHQLALQITVRSLKKNVLRIVLDEGTTTCSIISSTCWKDLGSPQLTTLETILKYFNRHFFKLHGILPSLLVELARKVVSV
jgi:hypothetical protein